MELRTILVTAATGNVGCHVVDQLLRAGQRVRALTRNPRNPKAANLPDGVEVVTGDLGAPHTLLPAFNAPLLHQTGNPSRRYRAVAQVRLPLGGP